jgi:LCP family protein required for cell wall assembly
MFGQETKLAVDFAPHSEDRRTRRQTIMLAVVFTATVAGISALGASASYRAASKGTNLAAELGNLPVISDVRRMVMGNASQPVAEPEDNRLNVLILGIGGDGHDGSQLTDTILLASVDIKEKRVAMLSFPRDLAYPLGGGTFEKINAVNAYAEQDHPGEGAIRTADAFEKLLEEKIDHVIRIDFRGFTKFIDALDGIDVNVERSFVDPQYPTSDDKWTTVSFKKGVQHMSGQTALVFARSRHGSNGEGSDFARSRRQQLVIMAVREKLLSLGTLGNPQKLANLYSAIASHVQTNLSPWELLKLAPLATDISRDRMTTRVLTDAPDGELVAANVNGAFMLFPKKPDWSEIRSIVDEPFATKEELIAKTRPSEMIRLEIKNGTTRTGFAAQVAGALEKNGYEIVSFGNALRRGYERSVIFDLTGGKKSEELAKIRKTLNATVSYTLPSWIAGSNNSSTRVVYTDGLSQERIQSGSTDFLVILGDASAPLIDATANAR